MGNHLRVLSESYPINTNIKGFRWFTKIFVSLYESSFCIRRVVRKNKMVGLRGVSTSWNSLCLAPAAQLQRDHTAEKCQTKSSLFNCQTYVCSHLIKYHNICCSCLVSFQDMCLVTCKFHLVLFSLNSLITSIHIPALTTTCLQILSKNSLFLKRLHKVLPTFRVFRKYNDYTEIWV